MKQCDFCGRFIPTGEKYLSDDEMTVCREWGCEQVFMGRYERIDNDDSDYDFTDERHDESMEDF